MRAFILSNPLHLAIVVFALIVVAFILWKVIRGAARIVVILVLLAAIGAALLWLKSMGPIAH